MEELSKLKQLVSMNCPKCGNVFLVASTDNWVCTKCYAKSTKDFEIHKVKRPKEEKKEVVDTPQTPQQPKEDSVKFELKHCKTFDTLPVVF